MVTRHIRTIVTLLLALPVCTSISLSGKPHNEGNGMPSKLYDFTVKTIEGKDRSLAEYKGKVVLIVNVASECGFTPQYKDLQEIYLKYKDKGFVILGFPSNEFGQQEPGTDTEIKTFCESKYSVTFDMFSKIVVKGEGQAPLYKYLTTECEAPHEITWNFNKFLVDRTGKVVNYFTSKIKPTDSTVTQKIEELLAAQN
jgi:glutathione peroxidase-family protein